MYPILWILLLAIVAPTKSLNQTGLPESLDSSNGFVFEMLMNKLENIQRDIQVLQDSQKDIKRDQEELRTVVLSKLNEKHQINGSIKKDCIPTAQETTEESIPTTTTKFYNLLLNATSYRSCEDAPINSSGKYLIQPIGSESEPFLAYCDQGVLGGGWLVIQYRFDGSVDFLRNWNDYRNGFGRVGKEHWLGLERIHQLTSTQPYELLIELKDIAQKKIYARYDAFEVAGEDDEYQLKTLGAFSGPMSDSLRYHQGMKFSTIDRDNDEHPKDLAADRPGDTDNWLSWNSNIPRTGRA
ncbi:angiopoietin-related protein 1-like [Anopheles darlingi]|uniref:angiopoietin-related protein 1-like n=1 Tax=Anopheles darlingi TaxID=43151 RepID=UPI0021002C87|nr:angiopoietin-related protein 1-like [Anopheles darlingi]